MSVAEIGDVVELLDGYGCKPVISAMNTGLDACEELLV
jgi:hypothetical protein